MARLLLILLTVLGLAVGCGGSEQAPPEAGARVAGPDTMLKKVLTHHFRGSYRLAYDSLHPEHQALVTRDNYAYCLKRVLVTTLKVGAIKTVRIADRPLYRTGIPERSSKAVTLRITALAGKMRDSWQQTFQAVRVAGRWAWILPDGDVEDYASGRCPAA